MSLLKAASDERSYGLELSNIAKIWRGGCIIRSKLLEEIRSAYSAEPSMPSLMLDPSFSAVLVQHSISLRKVVSACVSHGVPSMCLSSALAYFDAVRTERLPANLIQAQRDLFGAHTYGRIDKEGVFHTPDWEK